MWTFHRVPFFGRNCGPRRLLVIPASKPSVAVLAIWAGVLVDQEYSMIGHDVAHPALRLYDFARNAIAIVVRNRMIIVAINIGTFPERNRHLVIRHLSPSL